MGALRPTNRQRRIPLPLCSTTGVWRPEAGLRCIPTVANRRDLPQLHQMLRRTCSTYMAQITSVKDVQAHLRHTNAKTTLEHYIKSVPESVRIAVESFDQLLKKKPSGSESSAN